MRQRVRLRRPPAEALARILTLAFAVLLGYGGVLVALLALKVSPSQIEQVSDYQRIFHWAAGLGPEQFTTAISLIAGFGGLIVFLAFAYLTVQAMPRPYLARAPVQLPQTGRGETTVRPRAIERVAERAAHANRRVSDARGRLGDSELYVDVALRGPEDIPSALADVRRRVHDQLERHQLPDLPVNVTLTGYDPPTERDHP